MGGEGETTGRRATPRSSVRGRAPRGLHRPNPTSVAGVSGFKQRGAVVPPGDRGGRPAKRQGFRRGRGQSGPQQLLVRSAAVGGPRHCSRGTGYSIPTRS